MFLSTFLITIRPSSTKWYDADQSFTVRIRSHLTAPSLQANKFYLEKVVRGVLKEQYKGPTPTQKLAGRRGGINQLEKLSRAAEFEKYQHRNWREGDVYSPHDLSSVEMVKWKRRQKTKMDVFDALGINPLHEYKVTHPSSKDKHG